MKHPESLEIDTLNADWCDKDIVMLHACFQLLTDCVEKENLFQENQRCPENDKLNKATAEIKALYDWWKLRQTSKEAGLNELDSAQYAGDNAMLIRLVNVRHYLWT